MKVTIAHDWLIRVAGAEAVVKATLPLFDDVDILTSVAHPDTAANHFPGIQVRSLLSPKLPKATTNWERYAPAMIAAWSTTKVDSDLILVSNYFAAHGVARRATGTVVSYYHTPMRIAWVPEIEHDRNQGIAGKVAHRIGGALRAWDKSAAQHVDVMLANSETTQARIFEAYGRDSQVIYPSVTRPVLSAEGVAAAEGMERDYFMCFGRLVPYKRTDLAIRACNAIGAPLVVAGDGPDIERLKAIAGPTIRFEGRVSDERYAQLLRNARALLFPGEEDFGIVPVEASMSGTPLIAFGRGGVVDSLGKRDYVTLVPTQEDYDWIEALSNVPRRPTAEEQLELQNEYGPARFQAQMSAALGLGIVLPDTQTAAKVISLRDKRLSTVA